VKVTAIVVTNGVTTYLPMTLEALASQERAPDQVAVFDWSGTDNRAEISKIWDDTTAERSSSTPVFDYFELAGSNLGAVVRAGLPQLEVESDDQNWLWLLHDDSPPEPAALRALRSSVELSPSVAVAGCKQVGLTGSPLRSVGYTTSRFGRRLTGIEDGEVDQGQHDHRDDVLAVGTAGMLIRADVWEELGGPDRALGPYLDGQDLSRRARLAGHRTVVVPEAIVRHDRASFSLRRAAAPQESHAHIAHSRSHARRAAFYRRRQEFIHFQLVAAPLLLVPFLLLIALGAGLVRALGRIVLKEPRMISAEIRAPLAVWAAPVSLARSRAQARRSKRLPRRVLRPLQATWREVYALERDRRQNRAAARRALVIRDELDIAEQAQRATRRRGWLTLTLLAAVALTLTVLGPLVTAGQLTGGALAPSQASLADLWSAATGQYVAGGLGHDLPANPLLLVLLAPAALGSALGLNLGAVITALFILALPLAALNAWAAAGALTRSPAVRAWAALAWVVAPALQFALGTGRLGALLAHVFLPLAVLGAIRGAGVAATDTIEQRRPEGSVAAASGGALALAVVVGAAPALLPAAVALVVIAAVLARRKWMRMALMLMPALAVTGPLLVFARTQPALLAADPGLPLASETASGWQMLLGFPSPAPAPFGLSGPWDPWLALVAGAVIVLLAALALIRRARPGNLALFAWLIIALGLATAIAQSRITWIDTITAWNGSGVSLLWLGVLGGAVALSIGMHEHLVGRNFGWRQLAAGTLTVLAVLTPLGAAINWGWQVRTDQMPLAIHQRTGTIVPAVVAQAQRAPEHTRALVLEVQDDQSLSYQLFNRPIADFIDQSVTVAGAELDEIDADLAQAVGELATTADSSTVAALANYAIADVLLLPPAPGEIDRRGDLIATMDATAHLERVTANHYGILWRVNPETAEVSWARTESGSEESDIDESDIDESGSDSSGDESAPASEASASVPAHGREIETRLDAPADARTLVLAERASDNWRAWLDGVPLRTVTRDDGLQAFDLPETTGKLEVVHRPPERKPWIIAQGLVLGITALLAIPMRRRRGGSR